MNESAPGRALHRFAVFTAVATFGLVWLGGIVTSKGVGMAVPDWPNTYGYNMFFFPVSAWIGAVFFEHTHRLWASTVGLLITILALWLHGRPARPILRWLGIFLLLGGLAAVFAAPGRLNDAGFLMAVGLVSLAASFRWPDCAPAPRHLRLLGLTAFCAVVVQGLLGGLRVVLDKHGLGTEFGIIHGTLAHLFFVLVCTIALLTSPWWTALGDRTSHSSAGLARVYLAGTVLILLQLVIGATMRHQHAGLAIPDFPLAYKQIWPDMSPAAIAHYNASRIEIQAYNSITAFQVGLQMIHRLVAASILGMVGASWWLTLRWAAEVRPLRRLSTGWLALVLGQILLGALTIWTDKSADVATAHVAAGALSLLTGSLLTLISFRLFAPKPSTRAPFESVAGSPLGRGQGGLAATTRPG